MTHVDVCVVGGGIAGLSAAYSLQQQGIEYCLVESSTTLGGRIQTDNINGYLCDRGFQVLLPKYPTATLLLNYEQLELAYYPKGAVALSDQIEWFSAPFMMPKKWQIGKKISTKYSDWIAFATEVLNSRYPKQLSSIPTKQYIEKRYSNQIASKFLIPFFQGVFLDPKCSAPAELFRYYWRLFAMGGAAIPKHGMGQIPKQLASRLNSESLFVSSHVARLEKNNVCLDNGQIIRAKHVILACDQASLYKLIPDITEPASKNPVTTYFFSTDAIESLGPLNFILNATPRYQISIPTLIEPNYSSHGNHLCMVTCLSGHQSNPETVINQLKRHIGDQVDGWKCIHQHHIDNALPDPQYSFPKINDYAVCGDWLSFGSIESAMRSGMSVASSITKP